jgi:hypothetical protein
MRHRGPADARRDAHREKHRDGLSPAGLRHRLAFFDLVDQAGSRLRAWAMESSRGIGELHIDS